MRGRGKTEFSLISCASPCVTLMKSRRNDYFYVSGIIQEKYENGDPKGTRTPVPGVRGRCPRPLDDGAMKNANVQGQCVCVKY